MVRTSRSHVSSIVLLFTATLCLIACIGPQDVFNHFEPPAATPVEDTTPPPKQLECREFSFTTSSARPFERIQVAFESDLTPENALAYISTTNTLAAIEQTEQGWALTAPLSASVYEKGTVDVQIVLFSESDYVRCPTTKLDIEGLSRAPGTTMKALGLIKDIIALRSQYLGYNTQALRDGTDKDLPIQLHGPAKTLYLLDGKQNETPLTTLITDPTIGWSRESIELADAILAQGGYLTELQDHKANQERLMTQAPTPELQEQLLSMAVAQGQSHCALKKHLTVRIKTPAELSLHMRMANRKLLWTKDKLFNLTGHIVDNVAVIPGMPIKAATTIVSAVLYVDKYLSEAYAHTLPSILHDPKLGEWTPLFNEDDTEEGRWDNYSVRAKSKGWNSNAAVRDGALIMMNLGPAQKGTSKLKDILKKKMQDKDKKVALAIIKFLETHKGAITDFASDQFSIQIQNQGKHYSDKIFKKQEANGGKGSICYIPPQDWGRFDLGGLHHSDRDIRGAISKNDAIHKNYRMTRLGDGLLLVHADAERFPPQSNVSASSVSHLIPVHAIEVHITPHRKHIKVGETLKLKAMVKYANILNVQWSVVSGQGAVLLEQDDNTASVFVPDDYDGGLIIIRARSLSDEGLRQGKTHSEPREGFAYLSVKPIEHITLAPSSVCIAPSETYAFQGWLDQEQGRGVWSTSQGAQITNEGVFSSQAEGTYTVTYSADGNAELKKEATVTVSKWGCRCHWATMLSGPTPISFSDTKGIQATQLDQRLNITMEDEQQNGLTLTITGTGPSQLSAKRPGEYLAIGSVTLAGEETLPQSHISLGPPPKLVITQWEGRHIKGYYEAQVTLLGTAYLPLDQQIRGHVRATFSTYIHEGLNPISWIGPTCQE